MAKESNHKWGLLCLEVWQKYPILGIIPKVLPFSDPHLSDGILYRSERSMNHNDCLALRPKVEPGESSPKDLTFRSNEI